MPRPKKKDELIFAIKDAYSRLKTDLVSIPNEWTKAKVLDGHAKGTKMSISDLVVYLIG